MKLLQEEAICIREPSVCDVVCIRRREDSGKETLGMSVCVWRPLFVSGVIGGFRGGAKGAAAPPPHIFSCIFKMFLKR